MLEFSPSSDCLLSLFLPLFRLLQQKLCTSQPFYLELYLHTIYSDIWSLPCIPFLRATCQVLRIAPRSLVRHLRKSCFSPSVWTLPWAHDPVYTCLHSVRRASFWRASPSSQTAEESAHAFAPSVKFSLELLRFPLAPTKPRISYSLHVFPSLWVCRFYVLRPDVLSIKPNHYSDILTVTSVLPN